MRRYSIPSCGLRFCDDMMLCASDMTPQAGQYPRKYSQRLYCVLWTKLICLLILVGVSLPMVEGKDANTKNLYAAKKREINSFERFFAVKVTKEELDDIGNAINSVQEDVGDMIKDMDDIASAQGNMKAEILALTELIQSWMQKETEKEQREEDLKKRFFFHEAALSIYICFESLFQRSGKSILDIGYEIIDGWNQSSPSLRILMFLLVLNALPGLKATVVHLQSLLTVMGWPSWTSRMMRKTMFIKDMIISAMKETKFMADEIEAYEYLQQLKKKQDEDIKTFIDRMVREWNATKPKVSDARMLQLIKGHLPQKFLSVLQGLNMAEPSIQDVVTRLRNFPWTEETTMPNPQNSSGGTQRMDETVPSCTDCGGQHQSDDCPNKPRQSQRNQTSRSRSPTPPRRHTATMGSQGQGRRQASVRAPVLQKGNVV